ncbi:MAG: ImmA/IrrE family metallo-endopeptidase [Candidatus Limiplasma sp.]|nr:ImmA/IrrE family metallo-endopeptidase [Candidatus Limiplasma sp.]
MSTDELLAYAEKRGHTVFYTHLLDNKAISLEDGATYIALSKALHGLEEKEVFAHELGHCESGGLYKRHSPYEVMAKAEYRADKWAYSKLVPVKAVRRAIKKGVQTPWELAEVFEVSCEYMGKVLVCPRLLCQNES